MTTANNVISFPGSYTSRVPENEEINGINVPANKVAFLAILKERLELSEYESVLCAILDYDYYQELDHELQHLVLTYFRYKD